MQKTFRFIAPAFAALVAASTMAAAQSTGAPQPPQQPEQARRQQPSADTIERMQEGRIAMIKGALKMSDAQLKLWAPVETQLRARHAAFAKGRQDRAAAGQTAPDAQGTLPDRMQRRATRDAQRNEQQKAFAEVLKPLYATLSDEQKTVADRVLGDHRGGRHGGARHAQGGHGMHGGAL